MRLPAAAASILALALVAAACGGDDATPESADEATATPAATESAEETAAVATEAPVEEATAEATDEAAATPEYSRTAQHSSDDDPEATYALTSGRYRMEWRASDCEQVDILVSQVDGDFSYPKPSRSSYATATINDLPEGNYRIEQLDPACTDWSVRVDWMTN